LEWHFLHFLLSNPLIKSTTSSSIVGVKNMLFLLYLTVLTFISLVIDNGLSSNIFIPQSYSSSFNNSRGIQLGTWQTKVLLFPQILRKTEWEWKTQHPLLPSAFHFKVSCKVVSK
jgi:hypothetical protein